MLNPGQQICDLAKYSLLSAPTAWARAVWGSAFAILHNAQLHGGLQLRGLHANAMDLGSRRIRIGRRRRLGGALSRSRAKDLGFCKGLNCTVPPVWEPATSSCGFGIVHNAHLRGGLDLVLRD